MLNCSNLVFYAGLRFLEQLCCSGEHCDILTPTLKTLKQHAAKVPEWRSDLRRGSTHLFLPLKLLCSQKAGTNQRGGRGEKGAGCGAEHCKSATTHLLSKAEEGFPSEV